MPLDNDFRFAEFLREPLSDEQPFQFELHRHEQPGPFRFDMHYGLEAGIVLQGRMHRKWPGHEAILSSGGVWLCGTFEPHGWAVLEAPCHVALLFGLPQALSEMHLPEAGSQDLMSHFLVPPSQRASRARDEANLLRIGQRIAQHPEGLTGLLPRLLFVELLSLLPLPEEKMAASPRISAHDYASVQYAVNQVLNAREHIQLEALARSCGMNRQKFTRTFQNIMGISFSKYALRHRLKQAVNFIHQQDASLKEAAEAFGFSDSSHLHRSLRQNFGLTIKELKQNG